ncbi:hypothetical protein HYW53_02685 [Candidatus Giovannonibacteria bacterium]|nr:hypothetical protein [Candidatus Giovannonibacteria bacterium]
MLINEWTDVFKASFQNLWLGVADFVPRLIAALLVFIIGWIIAAALGRVVHQIVQSLKVDKGLEAVGMDEPLNRAGIKLNTGAFLGGLVKWFIILVFLATSLEILQLRDVTNFLQGTIIAYLPNVFVAALILVIAALVADTTARVVAGSAKAANLPSAGFLGGISKWSIWIVAILIAVNKLQIVPPEMVNILFMGIIGALSIALGLAFGLGGKDTAARFLDKLRSDISSR